MKETFRNVFYQLLAIYTLIIVLIAAGFFWKYSFQLHLLALVIGILGLGIVSKDIELSDKKLNKKLHYSLLILGLAVIFFLRAIPYMNNATPLGYDTGIYKYSIEYGSRNLDLWILNGGAEPLFLYAMHFLNLFLSSQTMLTWLLIGFCVLLGLIIYLTTKEYTNSTTGLIALGIYAFSAIQFKTFTFMYYKNIIGMSFMLYSFLFLRKREKTERKANLIAFIIFGGLLGAIHRPTFYIFGLSYFVYAGTSPYEKGKYNLHRLKLNILAGISILVISLAFYLGKFMPAISKMIDPVVQGYLQTGESPGTFINFFTYQFYILPYLIFAILGALYLIRKKSVNIIIIWAIINFAIVYFQFFFFNRFIIHLDLALIILAAIGCSIVIEDSKKIGTALVIILLICAGTLAYKEATTTRPLITSQELSVIQHLNTTEDNAFVLATSSIYSPWVLGYSGGRKTIAPGLFDYDTHNETDWNMFWSTNNASEMQKFLDAYPKPLYIFTGRQQPDNLEQFNDSGCFSIYYEEENNKIYKYIC